MTKAQLNIAYDEEGLTETQELILLPTGILVSKLLVERKEKNRNRNRKGSGKEMAQPTVAGISYMYFVCFEHVKETKKKKKKHELKLQHQE